VCEDEIDDGFGVDEAVRVVVDAGLGDDDDFATEFFVALFDEARVFVDGHGFIGVAGDMQQRDFGFGEWFEIVDGIEFVRERLFFRQAVDFQAALPITCRAFALAFAAGPAFEIADGCVVVNAGDFVGIACGPVQCEETASAETFE